MARPRTTDLPESSETDVAREQPDDGDSAPPGVGARDHEARPREQARERATGAGEGGGGRALTRHAGRVS